MSTHPFTPAPGAIGIVVNGEPRGVPDRSTLRMLVESLGLGDRPCAAEVNRRLVPRREHDATMLRDGDRIEIVTLVGGG